MIKVCFSRYALALLMMASVFFVAIESNADAATQKERAVAHINKVAIEAINMLSDSTLSRKQKQNEFKELLAIGFDTHRISRFVLGRYWRTASKSQRKEFVPLFEDYITRTYTRQISDYSGEQLEIGLAQILSKRETMVKSAIVRPKGPPIKLNWRVYENKKNVMRVVDIVVEGISMALTQRQEFSAVISKSTDGVEGLLTKLRKRAAVD